MEGLEDLRGIILRITYLTNSALKLQCGLAWLLQGKIIGRLPPVHWPRRDELSVPASIGHLVSRKGNYDFWPHGVMSCRKRDGLVSVDLTCLRPSRTVSRFIIAPSAMRQPGGANDKSPL